MWQRVHLAVVDGPDPGGVIELGAAGREITPAHPVTVGRGAHADAQVGDPELSRRHFIVHAGVSRWGAAGAWLRDAGSANGTRRAGIASALAPGPRARRFHLRRGSRFRAGSSTFEVRGDSGPKAFPLTQLALVLPLAGSLGFAAMWIVPGAGPWPLVAGAVLAPAGMFVRGKARARALPDPSRLRRMGLPAAHPPPAAGSEPAWRVELGNARSRSWLSAARRAAKLTLAPGHGLAFAGAGAPGLARWVAAQLLVHYGGHLTHSPDLPPVGPSSLGPSSLGQPSGGTAGTEVERYVISFPPAAGAGRPEGAVTIVAAPHPSAVPTSATHVVPVPAGHNRNVSARWLESLAGAAGRPDLPRVAHLRDHLPDLAHLPRGWRSHDAALASPVAVGVSSGGPAPVEIDLGGDSPHAIVAGTTGAGKSELLTSWLVGLAVRYPPAHVSMVLVDYKGGATFGALARLPHALEVLTDLDHPYTVRALESLRVEIHRREQVLKASASASIAQHNGAAREPLARLLIVVDEFRVLADEYPEVLDQLVRVAAQGRSLGIHVVLATQRPGGAMTPDIRANMGVRACLRVIEAGDSTDLLGTAEAAHLPSIPGRMLLRTETTRTVQALWAGPDGLIEHVVTACREAATAHPELGATHRPWAPALPTRVDLAPAPDPGHIGLAVSDVPEEQRLGTWQVPTSAQLVIAGEPGSGRSAAAELAAREITRAGFAVHALTPSPVAAAPARGTCARPGDAVTAHALLTRLLRCPGRDALIIDDAEALVDCLDDAMSPGEGAALVQEILKACRRQGRFAAVTTGLPIPKWAQGVADRVVFPSADTHLSALAGLPREFSAPGPPGRAVGLRRGTSRGTIRAIQLALPAPIGAGPGPAAAFQILPVPTHVDLPLLGSSRPAPGPGADPGLGVCPGPGRAPVPIVIGVGGQARHLVELPCEPGRVTVVLGESGAGKSRLARVITQRSMAVAGDLGRENHVHVVDDLHQGEVGALEACEAALRGGAHVVVTTTPEGLTAGFHPFLQRLRQADHTVFIGPVPRSLAGVNLGVFIGEPRPGRAALRSKGRTIPVQLDVCAEAGGL